MWKMRLVVFLILLLSIGMTAGAETVVNTTEQKPAVSTPPAATPVVKTSGPGMAVKAPGAEPAAAPPAAGTEKAAGAPGAATAVSAPPAGRPVAIIETNTYTFPAVMEGEEVKHDFVVRNKGDAPLIIDKVSAG